MIEEWADALPNKDAHRALSHHTANGVHFSLAPPLLSIASKEGLTNAEGLNARFATWQGPIGYEIGAPSIMIGDDIVVTIVDIRGDKVRLGIDAPSDIPVHRQEVYEAIQRENRKATQLKPDDTRDLGTNPSGR